MYSLALFGGLVCFLFFVPLFVLAPGSPLYASCMLFGAPCIYFLLNISALLIHQKKRKKSMSM